MFWEKIKEASLRDCVLESARKGIKRRLDTSSCFDKNRKINQAERKRRTKVDTKADERKCTQMGQHTNAIVRSRDKDTERLED